MTLVTKHTFDMWAKTVAPTALHVIIEAIASARHEFGDVSALDHRQTIARQLLMSRPNLVGTLASLPIEGALALATEELRELRLADPCLFVTSHALRGETEAWLRRHFGQDRADEIAGMVDRAGGSGGECWAYRYHAMKHLEAKGEDVWKLFDTIRAANDPKRATRVVPAQSPDGVISGADAANIDEGDA